MRRVALVSIALMVCCAGVTVGAAQTPDAGSATAQAMPQFRSGLTEISENWLEHDGDDLGWAQQDMDETGWQAVDDIEDIGPARVGWKWFRKRVVMGPDHPEVRLLISGGDGVYELFVNGSRIEGPNIKSAFNVSRPTERVFELSDPRGEFSIVLRTKVPANYAGYHLPLFLSITIGRPTVIGYEREALESERMYGLIPSLAINLLLCAAGLGGLALYRSQRGQREYLFLGLYLFIEGAASSLWIAQQEGMLPTSANYWIADPLIFLFTVLQIEFTFSFARVRPGRAWRLYEMALAAPLTLIPFVWAGRLSFDVYALIEAVAILPAGLLLPTMLFLWYRRGNREAGWLILPSLLPAVTLVLFDLGGALSSLFGWARFAVLLQPISLGAVEMQMGDLGNLIFLFAMAFVMFFRFTRVSREQARTAAELEAAREIQRRLVPESLPLLASWRVAAAYLPAQEVGGDFYQVLELADGSTLIVLGDVSGKGLKAAMTGTLAIGALRTLAAETLGPAELLMRLNRQMVKAQDGGFVTCIAARIASDGELMVANAGHLSPYWNGREIACEAGLPLGILPGAEYAEIAVRTGAGDRLTFLSDGVVEARAGNGDLLGFERTRELSTRAAAEIAEEARRFGQEDDITVLTLDFVPAVSVIAAATQPA